MRGRTPSGDQGRDSAREAAEAADVVENYALSGGENPGGGYPRRAGSQAREVQAVRPKPSRRQATPGAEASVADALTVRPRSRSVSTRSARGTTPTPAQPPKPASKARKRKGPNGSDEEEEGSTADPRPKNRQRAVSRPRDERFEDFTSRMEDVDEQDTEGKHNYSCIASPKAVELNLNFQMMRISIMRMLIMLKNVGPVRLNL